MTRTAGVGMDILGISAFYHDSAACLVRDGVPLAAAQEERFSRRKHDAGFPAAAIAFCLRQGGIAVRDLDAVVFYDKPLLKFERILQTHMALAPRGLGAFLKAVPLWLREKLWIRDRIESGLGFHGPVLFAEHHESHAASAFFPSPFDTAAILTMDGVGEWATTSMGIGTGNRIRLNAEIRFPHSLGLLYSAFTQYCGFRVNNGEYKLMGLAPYGEPTFSQLILDELVDLKEDGSFRLNLAYFDYCGGLRMINRRFEALFGGPARVPETEPDTRYLDAARSIQEITEEIVLRLARHIRQQTGQRRLCVAGGVALNCVANGKLVRAGGFDSIWIQPAAGDAGGALGAALLVWHQYTGKSRPVDGATDAMRGSLLGDRFSDEQIGGQLEALGVSSRPLAPADLCAGVADELAGGRTVGWFQGRMEFGPRALGCRSILADPRRPDMRDRLNRTVKMREDFRPFAPAILAEHRDAYFDLGCDSPYMLLVAPVQPSHRRHPAAEDAQVTGLARGRLVYSDIPAVTHVDGSARVQTVGTNAHPLFRQLLRTMAARHGCPLVVNTSLNVRGEPIVRTPAEAARCFARTDMDALALGSFLLRRRDLTPAQLESLAATAQGARHGTARGPSVPAAVMGRKSEAARPGELRIFGAALAAACLLWAAVLYWRAMPWWWYPAAAAIVAAAAALFRPGLLRCPQCVLRTVSASVANVTTVFLLTVLFFAVLVPLRLLAGLFGTTFLDRGFRSDALSYWQERADADVSRDYRRQF